MIENFRVTDHARLEIARRGISEEILARVITQPEQIVDSHSGRKAYQSRIEIGGKLYVVRAIVEETDPMMVITAYRTSKIEKYWRQDHESDL